jgi:hypothetical protein
MRRRWSIDGIGLSLSPGIEKRTRIGACRESPSVRGEARLRYRGTSLGRSGGQLRNCRAVSVRHLPHTRCVSR